MHELSIALSVLDLMEEEVERRGALSVSSVHLKLGPLSGVVGQALVAAYELAREGTPFEACKMVIQEIPIIAWCPHCLVEGPVESIQNLCCRVCGTSTPDVRKGRELEVSAMEICQ